MLCKPPASKPASAMQTMKMAPAGSSITGLKRGGTQNTGHTPEERPPCSVPDSFSPALISALGLALLLASSGAPAGLTQWRDGRFRLLP